MPVHNAVCDGETAADMALDWGLSGCVEALDTPSTASVVGAVAVSHFALPDPLISTAAPLGRSTCSSRKPFSTSTTTSFSPSTVVSATAVLPDSQMDQRHVERDVIG